MYKNGNRYKLKIKLEDNANTEIMVDKIIEIATKYHLTPVIDGNTVVIVGNDTGSDFPRIGGMINLLKKASWFLDNVTQWLFYDDEGGVEDLMLRYHL